MKKFPLDSIGYIDYGKANREHGDNIRLLGIILGTGFGLFVSVSLILLHVFS